MKFTTLRNLMASMLVVGVAGSVIAVGNGTFALFNATTNNTSNTFTTDDLKLSQNGCVNLASANSPQACGTLITLSNMIPGDSRLSRFYVENTSNAAKFTLKLAVDATAGTSTIDSTAPSAGGLGLFIFRCLNGSSAPTACTGSVTSVLPLYATNPGGGSCNAAITLTGGPAAFGTSFITVTQSQSDDSLTIGGGSTKCQPGNESTAIGSLNSASALTINGPDTGNVYAPVGAGGTRDQLALIVSLPVPAGNTLANKTATNLTMAFTATQVVGTAQ
jgi:hypothetical protein